MTEIAVAVLAGLAAFVAIEILFRAVLFVRGVDFRPPKRVRDLYVVPHPYLPYVFRPNARARNDEPARYPLHRGRFEFHAIRTNSLGLLGDDLVTPKPDDLRRILCVGASATENSIWEVGDPTEHSYPLHLQRLLDERAGPDAYEVANCGVGGWTTAEIFVNFALRLVDTRPDLVIFYHGLADLTPSLTASFRSDYSHARRNFGEAFERIRIASRFPSFPWWKAYSYLVAKFVGYGNVRHDITTSVRTASPDVRNPFLGLQTERRNIDHLIQLCRANRIGLILSTYAYHLYDSIANDPAMIRYRDGVLEENAMIRDLAATYRLPLVDLAAEIPQEDAFFVDAAHFTPLGMRFAAERFAAATISYFADPRSSAREAVPTAG